MGQANNSQNLLAGEYNLVRQLSNGSIVRETGNCRLHFVKEYSFTSQEAYQQAFVNFSKKLPQKHEHILHLQRTNTKLQNTFCSTFYKISLLYQYLEHSLQKEIQQRIQERKIFDQKEVWSVLCSCALAVSQMIRLQGRSHSALKTKDLRLTKEGVVKILSLEMVGMDADHDLNLEGTPKQLAITILNCLLMEQITNNSQQFLQEIVNNLDCSSQMKSVLGMMLNSNTRFIQLQQYLFKLVQEDTDSLNSYTHTPIMKQKVTKSNNSYSRIPEQSKEDDSLMNLVKDMEDNPQNRVYEPVPQQYEIPDENDIIDDSNSKGSQSQTSQRSTLRQKNSQLSSARFSQKKHTNVVKEMVYTSNNENQIFTDPKLLNLIHSNLEQINKRKSIAGSRKLGPSESASNFELKSQAITNNINTNSSINLGINNLGVNQYTLKIGSNIGNKELVSKSSTQISAKVKNENVLTSNMENVAQQVKSVANIATNKGRSESQQIGWTSQKQITQYRTNPEEKKQLQQEKRYENIMEIEEMGFKKNKNTKQKQQPKEDIRITFNPSQEDINTVIYNSNSSNSNTLPLTYTNNTSNNKMSNIKYSINQSKNELEYVSEMYMKGKYQGTKLNNMRHGKGVFYYNEGGKYIGEWKENKMDGRGVLYYPNNSIAYDGEWKQDQLFGKGTLYNEEVNQLNVPFDYKDWEEVDQYWVKYEGQFIQDSKNGEGKLYLSNGQIFEGHFRDDMVWGDGILLRRDGNRVRGLWRENKLIKLF